MIYSRQNLLDKFFSNIKIFSVVWDEKQRVRNTAVFKSVKSSNTIDISYAKHSIKLLHSQNGTSIKQTDC